MAIKGAVTYFALTAGSLGIVQGVTWFILTLLAVLIHFEGWTPIPNTTTYGGSITSSIMIGYLTGNKTSSNALGVDVFMRAKEFYIWILLFMVIAIFWFGLSVHLTVITRKRKKYLKRVILGWSIWTALVCTADLLLLIFLAIDFYRLVTAFDLVQIKLQSQIFEVLSCGIVMLITSRGIILWLVNLIYAIIMFQLFKNFPQNVELLTGTSSINSDIIQLSSGGPERSRDDRNKFQSNHSFGTFRGIPRIPIQSTNESLILNSQNVPFNLIRHESMLSKRGPPKPTYA